MDSHLNAAFALNDVHIIAIAGGSCSGKSTLVNALQQQLGDKTCVIVRQDDYYRGIDECDNFDKPEAIEFSYLAQHLAQLQQGQTIEGPCYSFETHSRLAQTRHVAPKPIILLDGILVLHAPELESVIDYRVFVECDVAIRKQRRLIRDVEARGRTENEAAEQFDTQVEPWHQVFVEPSKTSANIIVKSEPNNVIAGLSELSAYCQQLLNLRTAS